MAVPPHHFDDDPCDNPPGGLLGELERRQDDVLNQLDDLDAKLNEVLKGLEPASERNAGEAFVSRTITDDVACDDEWELDEDTAGDEFLDDSDDSDDEEDDESAEDWA